MKGKVSHRAAVALVSTFASMCSTDSCVNRWVKVSCVLKGQTRHGGKEVTCQSLKRTINVLSIVSFFFLSHVCFFALSLLHVLLSFSHTPLPLSVWHPRSSYPPSSHLRHVISLSISYLPPVPFCFLRFHNISTPSFHFDILHSLDFLAASMNTSLASPPYIYLFLISFLACLSLSICPLPVSVGSVLKGCRGRNQCEKVNCLLLTAQ